jgi:hypothetical protein
VGDTGLETRGLDEVKKQAFAAALRNVLAYEGIGVCGSSWGRWFKERLSSVSRENR